MYVLWVFSLLPFLAMSLPFCFCLLVSFLFLLCLVCCFVVLFSLEIKDETVHVKNVDI